MGNVIFAIVGQKFNYLTIISDDGIVNKKHRVTCKCDCGVIKQYNLLSLKQNSTKSCGCLRASFLRKHGLSRHPLNGIWASMRSRCYNKNSRLYKNYGARGVVVCKEWEDLSVFFDWCMSNGWQRGLHLDKDIIPQKLGIPALLYSPEMCTITTCEANQNAKKSNKLIEYQGKTQTIAQWGRELGFKKPILFRRLKKGWTIEEAFTTPVRHPNQPST